jgi:hypothetical protein
MYAVITTWTVAEAGARAQYREMRTRLIPPVEHLPGFVAGYTTLVPDGGTAYEFSMFDSEWAARAYMRRVGQDQPGQVEYGVQRSEVTLVAVVAVTHAE